jgi:hypothetical protein
LESDRGRRKKLRRNRLELLKWRAAIRAGFGTVAKMEDQTTPGERAKLLAVCWMDGTGEEWQRIAAELYNLGLRTLQAQGATIPDDAWKDADAMELFKALNPDNKPLSQAVDWNAAEASLKRLAGF